jgi:hypothetical protein
MHAFDELANEFIDRTRDCHGSLARPNHTHWSSALVTQAIQWLRDRRLEGRGLTEEGERFVASAAAYLGWVAWRSLGRRGLEASFSAEWRPGGADNHLIVCASRTRGGVEEAWGHDFLRDAQEVLLRPPRAFPAIEGHPYLLTSLSLPAVEYLYMTGVHFMNSSLAAGSWPKGRGAFGLEEDFAAARAVLVDDLHADVGLPADDAAYRRLSHWVVWPPYGWQGNDGQGCNLLALVDQIAVRRILPFDDGIAYLRALLRSQAFHLRNLAARALCVLGAGPADALETLRYHQAANASDAREATDAMVDVRWRLDGGDPATAPDADFAPRVQAEWASLRERGPHEAWRDAGIFADPLYERFGRANGERAALAHALRERHPGDWFADVAEASTLLDGDPAAGEARLRAAMASAPDVGLAHYTLAGWYWKHGRRGDATAIWSAMVRRWPWDARAVENAMFGLTHAMAA